MINTYKIKKGLDIPISGASPDNGCEEIAGSLYGVVPDDYPGYKWKVCVKPGDKVLIGTPLMYAREDESICLVSPVSGNVLEVCRGERRKVEYVSVQSDGSQDAEAYSVDDETMLLDLLCRSGIFALFRNRPFDIVPDKNIKPRDIFVTAFDSAPLAYNMEKMLNRKDLELGLQALGKLTSGQVYLGVPEDSELNPVGCVVNEFAGPHPAGNVGTQISALKPINKGDTVWTTDALTVCRIGALIRTGNADWSVKVSICGPEANHPKIVQTNAGCCVCDLLRGESFANEHGVRTVSGNVLTGIKVSETGFLRYPYRQLTLVASGTGETDFMGWASLSPDRYSVKRSFLSFFLGKRHNYHFDARLRGGERAFLLSGEYDRVMPFDIYAEFLLRAIMARDIEKMEGLGIYEVAPEDFALAEFVDTSKLPLQKIVREGLDYLLKETK